MRWRQFAGGGYEQMMTLNVFISFWLKYKINLFYFVEWKNFKVRGWEKAWSYLHMNLLQESLKLILNFSLLSLAGEWNIFTHMFFRSS